MMQAYKILAELENKAAPSIKNMHSQSRLTFLEIERGYAVSKVFEYCFMFLGLITMLGGLLIGYLSPLPFHVWMFSGSLLSGGVLVASGLALYAFGTRGFRRQLIVDANKSEVEFGRVNSNGKCRIATTVSFGQIESIFVKKASDAMGNTGMMMRVRGHNTPIMLLAGEESDLRGMHEQICALIKPAQKTITKPNRAKAKLFQGMATT